MTAIIKLLRPSHWIKNIFLFAALIFSQRLLDSPNVVLTAALSALYGFICFSLASSAMYIFNDIIDRNADRNHPTKSARPIASGQISIHTAVLVMLFCAAVAIWGSWLLVPQFGGIILAYLVLNILYSLKLKQMMILDVIIISLGFVFRAMAGAIVIGVDISPWLIICTFALCLFLGFGKRRSEISMLKENYTEFRKSLAGYTTELLSHMLTVSSTLAVISFLLYAMDDITIKRFGNNHLVFTTPLVLYCIFRFSALIQKGIYAGPVEFIIHDRAFQIGFFLWVVSCFIIIYSNKLGFDLGIAY